VMETSTPFIVAAPSAGVPLGWAPGQIEVYAIATSSLFPPGEAAGQPIL
jgi:hypothetical protein